MFYLYIYLDPRKPGKYIYEGCASFFYEPVYVGKGKGNRALMHLREVNWSKQTNNIKTNKIKKILQHGEMPIIIIMYESSENDVLDMEYKFITTIGTIADNTGPLTNIRKEVWMGSQDRKPTSRKGNGCFGKRFCTVSDGKNVMRVNASDLQTYLDKGYTRIQWKKPLKLNSKSRLNESNPMFGKTAVKGRRWVVTEEGETLFLTTQQIENLKVKFVFGRRVDKNSKKRLILEGEIQSSYMTDDEISKLPAGTRYQIGLIWDPGKKIYIVQ